MNSIHLIQAPMSAPTIKPLEKLFQAHWSDFTFDGYNDALPLPIVAVDEDSSTNNLELVAGGIAFTYYAKPKGGVDDVVNCESQDNENSAIEVVWINALTVNDAFQHRGIASQLINESVKLLSKLDVAYPQSYLYVYTDVPGLYKKCGWQPIEAEVEPGHQVLAIKLQR
jgi:GNAT superfamily N-acetyltransferase